MSVRTKRAVFFTVIVLILILVSVFAYINRTKLGRIFSPFFIAVVIAYIVKPIVNRLEHRKIPKMAGIIMVYAFFSALVASAVIFIIPEVTGNAEDLANTLPDISNRYQYLVNTFLASIQRSGWSEDIKGLILIQFNQIVSMVQDMAQDALNQVISSITGIILFLFDFSLALVIAYYFVKDGAFFQNLVMALTPRNYRAVATKIGREVNQVISSFIQGQLFTAFIVGILETIGLLIINVKYPLILGIFGGLSNVIPYFGPYIGAVPAVAVAFIDSPFKALLTVGIFALVQQIDNSFISPKVIESRLGLHPVTTILVVLAGQQFFGIIGMLVSVPIAAIVKVTVRRIMDNLV